MPWLRQDGDDVLLSIRVQPRAARDAIAGERDGTLVVRTTAPPVDGRANQAVCRLLAKAAGVRPTSVSVERGATGRDKLVRIAGADAAAIRARLTAP